MSKFSKWPYHYFSRYLCIIQNTLNKWSYILSWNKLRCRYILIKYLILVQYSVDSSQFRTHSWILLRKSSFIATKTKPQFSLLYIVIEDSVWTWILNWRFGIYQRLKKRQLYFYRIRGLLPKTKQCVNGHNINFILLKEGKIF